MDDTRSILDSNWYKIKASPSLNVRSSPSISGVVIGKIPNNGKIKVLSTSIKSLIIDGHTGRWVLVAYKKTAGYIFSGYLVAIGSAPSLNKPSFVGLHKVMAHPHLNVRNSPDVTGEIIVQVKKGNSVKVLDRVSSKQSVGGRSGYWVKIKSESNVGYVFDAFLTK